MNPPTILVTGATGTVGGAVLSALATSGATLIAGSRSGEAVQGVPGRVVDFDDPASLRLAMAGVDRLFLLLPLVPSKLALARQALAAAREAGVRHVVRSSGAGADPQAAAAIGRLQGDIDQLVAESGIPWTLLRPANFMQNWINYFGPMVRSGTVYLSHGDGKAAFVDAADIAAVAAAVLLNPAPHVGKVYTLTGPDALGAAEVLALIAAAGGPAATYVPVPEQAAVDSMKKMGMDDWTIDIMSSLNRLIAAGHAAGITGDVQAVTGRAPTRLADFVAANLPAWR